MYAESFPSRLKEARKQAGYSQRATANIVNIPYSTIANYETGRTQPDIENLGKLADFYCVSTDWLIGTRGTNWNPNKPKE